MSMLKSLGMLGASLALAGCAATSSPPQAESTAATHYWESEVSTTTYKRDNTTCQRTTNTDTDGALATSSLSFRAYRDCMIEKGYTLRTY